MTVLDAWNLSAPATARELAQDGEPDPGSTTEPVKRGAMEAALRYYEDLLCEGFCDDMPSREYTDENCELDCGGCKARATLARHATRRKE